MSRVTNLTQFLDEKGVVSELLRKPEKKATENLCKIVACVTGQSRSTFETNVACWGMSGEKSCIGLIYASIDSDHFDNIFWQCLECGKNGTISHWENTFWDCGNRYQPYTK